MNTIVKRFGPFPFGHRQHTHQGHCRWMHGHNWFFEIGLEAETLDHNGFVYDFGQFEFLKSFLINKFDHTFGISADDPKRPLLEEMQRQDLLLLQIFPSASAEGLAKYVFDWADSQIQARTGKRARLVIVTCFEDDKNVAMYKP